MCMIPQIWFEDIDGFHSFNIYDVIAEYTICKNEWINKWIMEWEEKKGELK